MKINRLLYLAAVMLLLFSACKKEGEIVTYPDFGKLSVSGSAPIGSKPLLIQIDGKLQDSMLVGITGTVSKNMIIQTGERKLTILDHDNKLLIDTTLSFTVGKTNTLPIFLYTGTSLLFDDLNSKPATPGNVLFRFVNNSASLPDLMNIEVVLIYTQAGARKIVSMDKKLNGITRNKFSGYLELVPPTSLTPTGATGATYIIIGTNAATGEVVMNVDPVPASTNNSYGTLRYTLTASSTTYVANAVVSLGIGDPATSSTKIRASKAIFARIAN
ncbi:hypothetical protein FA048_12980 [Pedobacter polaris]|uniref:DUF4397 domain-containing protein n=1 Tax=Pedobacter polaris TaxID=2571273 RepID=A0A4U1CLY3_9SPHI|nr:DUF4397 domain-containing protein [Pedobacter polaris]TKC08069.1 hypothetical protein FA048_12980 [Pedobacter polaris]